MKIFPHFNQSSDCPLCGKNTDSPAALIPDYTTEKDGNVVCQQVHLECLGLGIAKNDPENVNDEIDEWFEEIKPREWYEIISRTNLHEPDKERYPDYAEARRKKDLDYPDAEVVKVREVIG